MKLLLSPFTLLAFFFIPRIDALSSDLCKLQVTPNFRANYSAEFQHLRDSVCLADAPVLQVTCFGNLTILGTSDPSIQCQLTTPDFENRTTYQCINTCTDCSNVYLASGEVSNGPFASIYYTCEGETVQDVDSYVNYVGGNNGTCADSASSGTTVTRNFHVARLGVSCPVGSSRDYVYDDTYFECKSAGSFVLNSANTDDDKYSCASGQNCKGLACEVLFSDFYINADVPYFLDRCVESNVPITNAPTFAPRASSFVFSARFVASWGRLYEPLASVSSCTSENPEVIVSCENGASISFINSTDSTMNCTDLDTNGLKCVGSSTKIDNLFTSVSFDCAGPILPAARVTFPESTASCSGNAASTVLRHVATLGVECSLSLGIVQFFDDLYFECGEVNDQFDIENIGDYGLEENRFVCGQSATFPAESLSSNPIILSNASVTTDAYWLVKADESCFDLQGAPSSPSAPTPATLSPVTNAPISSSPTSGLPTESPTETEVQAPVQSPIEGTADPTAKPTRPPVTVPVGPQSAPPTTPEGSSSNAGVIAGGAIAGIAVVAIVAFLLVRKNRQLDSSNQKPYSSGENASSSQSNTDSHTEFQGSSVTPQSVVARPYAAPSSSLAADVANARAPTQPQSFRTSYSGAPIAYGNSYDVRFKDQAQSVVGHSQSSVPMVVPGVPISDAIPVAVAMDSSGASGNSRNSIKSEPPGRRAVDP